MNTVHSTDLVGRPRVGAQRGKMLFRHFKITSGMKGLQLAWQALGKLSNYHISLHGNKLSDRPTIQITQILIGQYSSSHCSQMRDPSGCTDS